MGEGEDEVVGLFALDQRAAAFRAGDADVRPDLGEPVTVPAVVLGALDGLANAGEVAEAALERAEGDIGQAVEFPSCGEATKELGEATVLVDDVLIGPAMDGGHREWRLGEGCRLKGVGLRWTDLARGRRSDTGGTDGNYGRKEGWRGGLPGWAGWKMNESRRRCFMSLLDPATGCPGHLR